MFPLIGEYEPMLGHFSYRYKIIGCYGKSSEGGNKRINNIGDNDIVCINIEVWDVKRFNTNMSHLISKRNLIPINQIIRSSAQNRTYGPVYDMGFVLSLFSLRYCRIGDIKHIPYSDME